MTEQKTKQLVVENIDTNDENLADLIVFNDDINEFEYVIKCFMVVCGLSHNEALERTEFIHYTGLGKVKTGTYHTIKQMKDRLVDCGLTAIVARKAVN